MKRRVVITGMGALSPIGNSAAQTWENARAGVCGIAPITRYDTKDRAVTMAGELKGFDPEAVLDRRDIRKMDRFSQYAAAAAAQAMEDANLGQNPENADRIGVIIGSGIGGIRTIEQQQMRGGEQGFDRVSAYFIPMAISNMAAAWIALNYGLHGICACTVTACASAANAIGDALLRIREGTADVILCGGAEAAITPLSMGGFTALRALSRANDPQRASIPFDADHSGFVMGEGAGVLVLEELEHAKKRGARIYSEVAGFAANCDAYHITAPSPDGKYASECMAAAIRDSGLAPCDINYVNAHGTSTPLGDRVEMAAIRRAFGAHAESLAISSTKSMTGHLLGAAAAIEAVITAMAVSEDFAPPTINYRKPDPECDLDIVPNVGRKMQIGAAISNSFGFGGSNATLVFKKYEPRF